MSVSNVTPEEKAYLDTLSPARRASLDERIDVNAEIATVAKEYVAVKLEEEAGRTSNHPLQTSAKILEDDFLARWPVGFRAMNDPAVALRVNRLLAMLNRCVNEDQAHSPGVSDRLSTEVNPATRHLTMLELIELDLIAASVARASLNEDLKQLVEVPPNFANHLKTAILRPTFQVKFPFLKVEGNTIMKVVNKSTEPVNQGEMDEYVRERFPKIATKLVKEYEGVV